MADSSPLAEESSLLARALEQSHGERNYVAALATLDRYDARFPNGALRREAMLARLDARLAMGQSAAALRLLDQNQIEGVRAGELLILRAELRASAGRCREAIEDFSRALATAPRSTRLHERVLLGRAACRGRIGDGPGAQKDRDEYRRLVPEPKHP